MHYLNSVADILQRVAASGELTGEHAEDLMIARRLLDILKIETEIAPEAATRYFDAVGRLLSEGNLILHEGVDHIVEQLKDLSGNQDMQQLDTFLTLVAKLQSELNKGSTTKTDAVKHSLINADTGYAKALFTAGLTLPQDSGEISNTRASNQKNYDEGALLAFILDRFPDNEGVEIEHSGFISGGHSKLTLRIELSAVTTLPRRIILRSDASGRFSGASVVDEYRLQTILFDKNVNVPKPLALEESGTVFGTPFMLSESVTGESIGHMFKMPAQDSTALADVASNLATIHKIAPGEFGESTDNARGKTSDKVQFWLGLAERDFRATDVKSATFELALHWLRKNAGLSDLAPRTLVHGDYGLNNILIKNSQVMAILDWEFAHIGNPAYDLGYFYFMAQALGSWALFLEAYENTGAPLPDEDQLNYNILLAATRVGVQCCQVHSAFNAGVVSGPEAARVVSHQYVNESILRISELMERIHHS